MSPNRWRRSLLEWRRRWSTSRGWMSSDGKPILSPVEAEMVGIDKTLTRESLLMEGLKSVLGSSWVFMFRADFNATIQTSCRAPSKYGRNHCLPPVPATRPIDYFHFGVYSSQTIFTDIFKSFFKWTDGYIEWDEPFALHAPTSVDSWQGNRFHEWLVCSSFHFFGSVEKTSILCDGDRHTLRGFLGRGDFSPDVETLAKITQCQLILTFDRICHCSLLINAILHATSMTRQKVIKEHQENRLRNVYQ